MDAGTRSTSEPTATSHDASAGGRQPYLFDLTSCVNAPSLVLSSRDGQIRVGGVEGWTYADRRMLSRLELLVNGFRPVGLTADQRGASGAVFRAVLPQLGDPIDDPTVLTERTRELGHDVLTEEVRIISTGRRPVSLTLTVSAAADLSPLAEVRSGRAGDGLPPSPDGTGLRWSREDAAVTLTADPAPDVADAGEGTLTWRHRLAPGGSFVVRMQARAHAPGGAFKGAHRIPWRRPEVAGSDERVPQLLQRSLDDLEGLLLVDPLPDERTGDAFLAAGSPWYLTLFGRDSLWAARMMLPVGTDLALSTLRVLARRQGVRHDPSTEEQPGRILHEVRSGPLVLEHLTLPPTYYGTADATQLFVILCAESWRWGADPEQLQALLPAVERALAWVEEQTADGFLRYVDATGKGLSNQGWKDSRDSIQWADGSLAEAPLALSEVQAYSYQAAVLGADLLEAFGHAGAEHWRAWAAALRDRFRDAFWVDDDAGGYPAVALDARGARVDSVASNMGHLLGTGLLDSREAALVARRLADPAMSSGFGLRTLSSSSPRYSPLSYHGGSVWPHDTAIAVSGLAREGFDESAGSLFRELVRASPSFDFRLPELYGGCSAEDCAHPPAYPAACRPQAWSAAAPLMALVALLGLDVDVPRGRVRARPRLPQGLRPLTFSGLRIGEHELEVDVDADGVVRLHTDHPGVELQH